MSLRGSMGFWSRLCAGSLALWASLFCGAVSAEPKDVVVMVDARHGRGSGTAFGAGLVVSQTPARTVIITALHVVANEAGDLAAEIGVEFSARRGRTYVAAASPYYTDRELDLAVLLVEHDRSGMPPEVLAGNGRRVLSPTRANQLVGAKVSLIGAMNRERWARGPTGDTVVGGNAQQLRVRSVEAMAGASGGGVFDSLGRLLGIASRIDSVSGELIVIPIEDALARLKRWGIEVSLEPALAESTEPGLVAQMRSGLRFEITYTHPEPNVPGGMWGPGQSFAGDGFRHRLRAVLSPALTELAPDVRIEFPQHPTLNPIDLKGPTFTVEASQFPVVFEAQAVLLLPDRRRIGPVPVTLDFATAPKAAAQRLGNYAPDAVARSRAQFDFQERESRAARERGGAAVRDAQVSSAIAQEASMRESYTKVFPHWRLLCEKVGEKWSCRPGNAVPRHPYGGKLANVVHSLKIGASERDLSVNFPIDPAVDLGLAFPKEAASLLNDGASELFVWMRLATGEALGPKRLCEVKTKRRGTQTVCD